MPANTRFHTMAFFDNVDNAALAQLPAVPEGLINVQNGNLVVPPWNLVGAVYGYASALTGVRLTAPSLTGMWPIDVPVYDDTNPPTIPYRVWDRFDNPQRFVTNEQLQVQTINGGAMAIDQAVFLWLLPKILTPIQSDIRTLHASGSTTVGAGEWTQVPITLDSQLPAGTYSLCGLYAFSATMLVARVVFVGGNYRPGVVAQNDLGVPPYFRFTDGNIGVFGEFEHNLVPTIEVFCLAADTAQDFALDLVKIA